MHKSKLILLDFDGTLTTKDTLFAFIKYYHGWRKFLLGILVLSPLLILLKFKILSRHRTKEFVLTWFFKNESITKFDKKCSTFSQTIVPMLIRNGVSDFIKSNTKCAEICIVSASVENWIIPWATAQKIVCIGTKLEVINGKITGKIEGKNCNGIEKVNRVKKYYDTSLFHSIIAYGDTSGDLEMLKMATESHFRYFHALSDQK